ncbi:MAG: NAD(+) synthase [Armatimonadota bacterium]
MKLIKVAAAVLNQTPLDWDRNRDNILDAIAQAKAEKVSVLCLPELCLTGYGCEDAFHAPGTRRMARQVLQEILPATAGMIVSLGLPVLHQNGLFNTACLVADGQILGFAAKQHLAGGGLHYEPRWFKPWPTGVVSHVEFDDERYPIGDLYFDCGGIRFGFEICEDAWVAGRPGGTLSRKGVDIILNPSASHFAFGKYDVRKRLVEEASRAFGVTYIYSNLVGNEAGRAIYDGGALIASGGLLIASGPRFTFADFAVTSAVVDVDATRTAQARTGSFTPEISEDESSCVRTPFSFPPTRPTPANTMQAKWEKSEHLKEEEFTRAVALGLFDYLRKSHSNGFVVSLSGGADSSAVACLVASMVELGVGELKRQGFYRKLPYLPALEERKSTQEIIHALLICIYQRTRNSSDTTFEAAHGLAEALGAEFLKFDVDALVEDYCVFGSTALGRLLSWEQDDLALQNIQARGRAPGVWLVANLRNALLLATSNRSEAAVGYTTMDGDTCGGLSPIAGIDKAFLCRWLVWMQTAGPEGLHRIPALAAVTRQAPTAELRPLETVQTDEKDLMPYEVLDAIERAAIRDKQMPVEIFTCLRPQYPQYSDVQFAQWIERFFTLWCRNQWKRERYAPSFHLDDENLDPKTWCRFPILSGGYQRELAELRALVMAGKV